jgi:Domain of unknown function (DUF4424)
MDVKPKPQALRKLSVAGGAANVGKRIRVHYQFYNRSNRDIVTQVAFPMPDIPYGADDFNFAIPTNDPEIFLTSRPL